MNLTNGMKSSEFLITLVTLIAIALSHYLNMTPDQVWQLVSATGLYGAARAYTKSNETK